MNECSDLSLFYKNIINNRKFSDKLGRYYTPIAIAEVLCKQLGKFENSLIADLGCGSGNLITGSLSVWGNCKYHAYDIDGVAIKKLDELSIDNLKSYQLDLIIEKLPESKYDAAISNPPYINLDKEKIIKYLDKDTFFEKRILDLNNIPAPLIFLSKALKCVKKGGKVGIILPNGILKNKVFSAIRKSVNESYTIKSVITLKPYTFDKTETYASILIIEKSKPQQENQISFYQLDNYKLTKLGEKPIRDNDYIFEWNIENIDPNCIKLNSFIENIFRGKYSSKYIKNNPSLKIFHTTNFEECNSKYVPLDFHVTKGNPKEYAQKGDIVIGRVGRNSFQKIKLVQNNYVQISDCIIVIRPIKKYTKYVYDLLKSDFAQNYLNSKSKGTGAKYITYQHILNMPADSLNGELNGI